MNQAPEERPGGENDSPGANPLAGFIEVLRRVLLRGEWPEPGAYAGLWVGALAMFYLGRILFMRKKTILVDII